MKVLATGGAGMLGAALKKVFDVPGVEYIPIDIAEADITVAENIAAFVTKISPDIVINCAAFTDVDGCETKKEIAFAVNGSGAGNVAAAAAAVGAPVIHISTDYVFDGSSSTPYVETDPVNPMGVYGASKLEGERAVAAANSRHYILRTAWLYGAGGKNFVDTIAKFAQEREELSVVSDQVGSPTYTMHLASAIKTVADRVLSADAPESGIFHATGGGRCSWFEFAGEIVKLRPGKTKSIKPVTTEEFGRPAPRPAYSVMNNQKIQKTFGVSMPHWLDALKEYLA